VPTIAALRARGERVVRQVLAENEGRWDSLSEADRERVELVAAAIAKRLLQQPILRLKARDDEHATYAYIQALRELFDLDAQRSSAFGPAPEPKAAEPQEARSWVTPLRPRKARRNRR
jgi:hypothetical protein